MFTTSQRPIGRKATRALLRAGGLGLVLLGLSSSPALAGTLLGEATNTSTTSKALALCPGQIFSQPFAAVGDYNYYTLVPGSEFNNPPEGWELQGGAHVVSSTLPDGSSGHALELPSGSVAVSAPVCVTLSYPTARVYTNGDGNGGVNVAVSYAGTRSETKPRGVTAIYGANGWTASEPFKVLPQLAGKEEGAREVRFVFTAGGSSSTLLYGLYVDPYAK
jgi:hypothetical protein